MKEKYPEIPMEYIFTDTGKELPELYEFLDKLEDFLGQKIIRLNPKTIFDDLIKKRGGYMPSMRARWCTMDIKIAPFNRYVKKFKREGYKIYIYMGIRVEESYRASYGCEDRRRGYYKKQPFVDDGIDKKGVIKILNESGLGMPKFYEYRLRSGCYFCFYQRKIEWVWLKEKHPELYEKAKGYEKCAGADGKGEYYWNKDISLERLETPEVMKEIKRKWHEQQEVKKKQGYLEGFGNYFDDEAGHSCFTCHK